MERWLFLAFMAALFWGGNAVLVKLAVGKEYYGLEPSRANFFVGLGVLTTMLIYDRMTPVPFYSAKMPVYALSFLVGIVWALGNIFAFRSIEAGGKMSQVVPIYNTNTLIAVFLVIVLLKEVPTGADLIRVIAGAILITVGAILVS
ncbi:MAG: GRP family sugar transporter [bacterium]|nr:GRP family sugar transporter [bacterium]